MAFSSVHCFTWVVPSLCWQFITQAQANALGLSSEDFWGTFPPNLLADVGVKVTHFDQ